MTSNIDHVASETLKMPRRVLIPVLLVSSLLTFAANADEIVTKPVKLGFTLTAFYERKLVQDKHDPLRLEISLANPTAQNAQMRIDEAERLKFHPSPGMTQEEVDMMTKLASSTDIPTVTIGSEAQPLPQLISFVLVDAGQKPHALSARLMPGTVKAAVIKLDAKNAVHLSYGVDPKELSSFSDGQYQLKAIIDQSSKPGELGKHFESNAVDLKLSDKSLELSKDEDVTRLYRIGKFYIEDKKYDEALRVAQQIEAIDPGSPSADEVKGDAYAGQNKLEDAKQAYISALDKLDKKFKDFTPPPHTVLEPPTEIMDKLSKVLKAIRTGHKQ